MRGDRSGTIWASSLAHSATNSVGGGLSYLWLAGVKGPTWTGYGGMLALPVLLAVCVCLGCVRSARRPFKTYS